MFYIPSGMIHAVGKGLVIAEIQQSANTTYLVDGVGFNKGESGIVPACNKACAISGKASVLRFWK